MNGKGSAHVIAHILLSALVASLTVLLLILLQAKPAAPATLPASFEDHLLTSVSKPIALAFRPDGRMIVATQPGQLQIYKNGQLVQTPALDISSKLCTSSERGLLGVAVDPSFSTNKYVYLYYTYNKSGVCPTGEPTNPSNPVNRVSRFVMPGDTVDPASEKVLIDNIPSPNGNHNAGDLRFGRDGYLYVTVGMVAVITPVTLAAPGPTMTPATGTSSWARCCA